MTMLDTADTPETAVDLCTQVNDACELAHMTAQLAWATEYHMSEMRTYMARDDARTHEENQLRALVFALRVQTKELHRQIEALTEAIEN